MNERLSKFFISNSAHPCTEIILDVNKIRSFYLANGWEETQNPQEADDLIISTCAYNQHYEVSAVEDIRLRKLQLKNGARLIVAGCLSKINPELFDELKVSERIAPLELSKFDDLLKAKKSIESITVNKVDIDDYKANPLFYKVVKAKEKLEKLSGKLGMNLVPNWMATFPTSRWFVIRGSTGCMGTCTYCAVRKAKGKLKSVLPELIIDQVESAIKQGFSEISLAGDDMGAWGVDLGSNLAEVLPKILAVSPLVRVNLRFVEPKYLIGLIDKLIPIFETGRISAFCVPIQSGSDKILRKMGRDYGILQLEEVLKRIAGLPCPPKLASIIMVGFPGETKDDLELSSELIDRLPVDFFQILPYEGRPNTPSLNFPDQIPEDEKKRRHDKLLRKFKLRKIVHLPSWVVEKIC
ncbi:MAG: radical SAM protein [Candidatus Riflebacteria bacterium]|nr:radical SAM protein [Candidatus Riflebacteria bacterium]